MDELVPFGSAKPYRLEDGATGYRLFCISNTLWPCMSGCLSDNLLQFTPDAEELLTTEVLTLSSSMCLTEITSRLDALIQAILGCKGQTPLLIGHPGIDEMPDPIERGVGDPPIGSTWGEYDDILCQQLQRQVDLCVDSIDSFTDGLGLLGLMGLDMLALYLAPLMPPVALLIALLGVLATILEDELFDQWAGELNAYAKDAICAAFLSYTPATAKAAIDAAINLHVTPEPNRLFHKVLWSQSQVNRIFNGELDDYSTYDPEYCDVCTYLPIDEWHFDGSLEGWFFVEGKANSKLEYNPNVTHTPDGTGCAEMWLDYYWYGQWHSRAQVNTYLSVVANQHLRFYHSQEGDIRESIVQLYYDDDTSYMQVVGDPFDYPVWKEIIVDVPAADIGKKLVAIRLSWQGNNDYVYFDDVEVYVS